MSMTVGAFDCRPMAGQEMAADPAQMQPCECEGCVSARAAKAASAAQRLDAETKSRILLCEWLSPAQLAQFERNRFFEVVGSKTGKRYHILECLQQNVFELDKKGRRVRGLCFVPQGGLPTGDVMLAQKIALETDEEEAMKVALSFWGEPAAVGFVRWAAAIWGG
jgi:hypothetical protein